MRQLFLSGLLLLICLSALAQQQQTTLLLDKLKTVSAYPQKAAVLLDLSKNFLRVNPDSAYLFARQLQQLSTAREDKPMQYKAVLEIARYFTRAGKPKEALNICDSVLKQMQDIDTVSLQGNFWQVKGNSLMRLNQKREALTAFYKALKFFEKVASVQGIVGATTNIGWVYMEMFQYEKAIAEFHMARSLAEENAKEIDPQILPVIYNNLASCYGGQNKTDSAFLYTNKSIDAALKNTDYVTAANGLNILGTALMEEKRYKEALDKLLQAKPLREKAGDPFFIVSDMATLARLYAAMGNTVQGVKTCEEALDIVKENKITAKLPMIYQALAGIYEQSGNYKKAADTYKLLSNLKDTLFENASAEAIAGMKVQYETEKKENENLLLKKENALKAAVLINKNRTISILVVSALLVAALMFSWVAKVRLRKKESELKAIADLQKEKERIARDLHDNVGGQLSYIIYSLDGINEERKEKRIEITESINQSVRSVIGNLRETIWAISDANIKLQDFSDKLKLYARSLFNHSSIKVAFTENISSEKELNALLGLNLYRVCQEILTNAFKHSRAGEVSVNLELREEKLMISIADNGTGFDISQQCEDSYGLQNIYKRANEFGIGLTLDTGAGKGTRYELIV